VALPKCAFCQKRFKKSDEIVVVDGNYKESVHIDCHYNYLSHLHLNNIISLDESKEVLNEEEC